MAGVDEALFVDVFERVRGYRPYPAQEDAICSHASATWVLAGPGTGKTEVLVLRTLKLLLVDRVPPESIVLTTFTNRAADNLLERLHTYTEMLHSQPEFLGIPAPNLSGLWIGTLHSIAYDMLRQFDVDSERIVMLDEASSTFHLLRQPAGEIVDGALYQELNGGEPAAWNSFNRIHHAERLKAAMSRIVEDNLDLALLESNEPLRGEAPLWQLNDHRIKFLDIYDAYKKELGESVDYSLLQLRFLNFLNSDKATSMLSADDNRSWPGIQHVIVDEYQDTNPIQEAIYFALVKFGASLMVVGDDDQSLYRFRGASVDAMLGFPTRCVELHPNVNEDTDVVIATLSENRRSHPKIVAAVNNYVRALIDSRYDEARAPKPDLEAKSDVSGNHTPFFVIVAESEEALANGVANITLELKSSGVINDLRQVALLSDSTKATTRSSFRHYEHSFNRRDLPLFNPGSKTLHQDPFLQEILGFMCSILDVNGEVLNIMGDQAKNTVNKYLTKATKKASLDENLRQKLEQIIQRFDAPQRGQGEPVPSEFPGSWSILRLFYEIVNQDAYNGLFDKEGGPTLSKSTWRLGWMTQMLKSFQNALPGGGRLSHVTESNKDFYEWRNKEPPQPMHGVNPYLVDRFYRDFVAVFDAGGFNEIEDGLTGLPVDMTPALTIHQSKGLEFPIVFICAQRGFRGVSPEHHQERLFHPYRVYPMHSLGQFTGAEQAIHDDVRRLFVAMSRAQYACGLCLTREVYDGIVSGHRSMVDRYPHIPPVWLANLEVVNV
jgi:DNA helicase-2/ATP-dependent DNA helicase PcrA